MKSLYWRSNSVPVAQLVIVAILAVAGLVTLERNPSRDRDDLYEEKLRAARLAEEMFRAVYVERISQQIPLEREFDPAGSGLIGPPHSPIVSNEGHLDSKQTSANPNFAAVFVEMIREAGVTEGDRVAVNCTGSFPAMNLNVYAALEAIGADPIIVSSVAASEYGATHPDLTWLDMERVVFDQDLVSFHSHAVTMGGVLDVARNHSEEGRELIRAAIERNGRPLMYPQGYEQAVSMRMELYDEVRADQPIRLFINVGGGTASVGTHEDKHDFRPGLNTRAPRGLQNQSVMRTFLEQGVPVIHVTQIRGLARRYGLPDIPASTPSAGEGGVFTQTTVDRWAILLVLGLILAMLFAATRFDVLSSFQKRGDDRPKAPEPML